MAVHCEKGWGRGGNTKETRGKQIRGNLYNVSTKEDGHRVENTDKEGNLGNQAFVGEGKRISACREGLVQCQR